MKTEDGAVVVVVEGRVLEREGDEDDESATIEVESLLKSPSLISCTLYHSLSLSLSLDGFFLSARLTLLRKGWKRSRRKSRPKWFKIYRLIKFTS